MAKVAFIKKNIMNCVCGKCPVQLKSQCVKDKTAKIKAEMSAGQEIKLDPEKIPWLYCSSGVASCTDINTKQMCICGTCPVWAKLKLAKSTPRLYFCRDGQAL